MKTLLVIASFLILFAPAFSQVTAVPDAEKYVGYYNVGVRPGMPFFKAKIYQRQSDLYIIFDGDKDHKLVATANGTIRSEWDTLMQYSMTFDFEDNKAISFKVSRPRDKWPTDLYARRISTLEKFATDTETTLTSAIKTTNFKIQFTDADSSVAGKIVSVLEAKYKPLIAAFGLESTSPISIKIYPDLDTYHNAVLTPGAPSWQMGRAWTKNEIRMLSPVAAQKISNEQMNADEIVLHEFVHCLHLHLVKSATRVPGWLWEGVAMYKGCCRWGEVNDLEYVKKKKYPSLKQIEQDKTFQKKYELGYSIIEFIDKEFGWEKVIELIRKNGDMETVLGISAKEFERKFYDSVIGESPRR